MMIEVFILSAIALMFACFAAYLVIQVPMRYTLKFLIVPAAILLGIFMVVQIPKIMGSPIQERPEELFEYLAHAVMEGEEGELSIQLWANTEGDGSKLYEFEFDQQTLDALKKMQEMQQQGLPAKGRFDRGQHLGGVEDGQEIYQLNVEEPDYESILPPK